LILLARHGQTDFNAPPTRIQGSLDPPLNETGLAQARALAELVADEGIRVLYASDMLRARQTAEIVGERIGLEPVIEPRVRECAWGAWEGRLVEDIAREEPEQWQAWLRAGDLPALVVCHGGTIRVALAAADPRGLDAYHEFHPRNGELVRLERR
jgi:broad specificity phosphatase PhoE